MLRLSTMFLTVSLAATTLCEAQVGGNLSFSRSNAKSSAQERENRKRVLLDNDLPPSSTSSFVEANVLMNVVADEYIAVFGLAREGATPEECERKMAAMVKAFTDALKQLGITDEHLFVDFVTQSKIYGFEMAGDIAREKLVGFELKKNVSVQYADRQFLDKLMVLAAKSEIHDLIKVDYVVRDIEKVHEKLMEEAARVIKRKIARYEQLLGMKLQSPAQVFAERSAVHYPTEMYDSFVATESEQISGVPDRQKYTIQSARKSRTFVFNGLDGDGFDAVINPVILEPVVQFTLYFKVKYEVEQLKAK